MRAGRLRLKPVLAGLFLFLLVIGVVAVCVPSFQWWVLGTARGEYFFQGYPTSYWQGELDNLVTQNEARQALVSGGEKAVPVLVQMLERRDRPCGPVVANILFDTRAAKTATLQLLNIIRDSDHPNHRLVWSLVKKYDPKAADDAMFRR
jgi:hypothetical protein